MYRLINEESKKEQERWKQHSKLHGANEHWALLEDASHAAICWRQTKERTRLKGTEDFKHSWFTQLPPEAIFIAGNTLLRFCRDPTWQTSLKFWRTTLQINTRTYKRPTLLFSRLLWWMKKEVQSDNDVTKETSLLAYVLFKRLQNN